MLDRKKVIKITFPLLLALLLAWFFFSQKENLSPKNPQKIIPVQSAVVLKKDLRIYKKMSGFASSISAIELKPQVMATVASIPVKEGQFVKAGDTLFTLDTREIDANINKLAAGVLKDEALLEDAKRNLIRNTELLHKNFISQSEVDSAQSAVDAALAVVNADKAELSAQHVIRDYYTITAPQTGRLGEINCRVGSVVQPSMALPMSTLTALDPIEVTFYIPEQDTQKILAALTRQDALIEVEADHTTRIGKLSFIDNTVDATSGALKAKAIFANTEHALWPGQMVMLRVSYENLKQVLVVPLRGVQVGPSGQFLYVITNEHIVKKIPISVVRMTPEHAVIKGVLEGTKIVIEGGQNLRPNMQVNVVTAEQGQHHS